MSNTKNTKNTGGPAFPITLFEGQELGDGTANGMTLRDYFAAKAMQGLVSTGEHDPYLYDQLAKKCYILANCMLKAREQ